MLQAAVLASVLRALDFDAGVEGQVLGSCRSVAAIQVGLGGGMERGSGPSPAFGGGGELMDVGVSGGEMKERWLGASTAVAWG
jgi:hypothetical protein